ncbi:MAG: hypothetical protein M3N34_10555 [Pseudomonadota bacterium]|nr:hypothetical protein [Pseudomonadota bacterium]
MVAAMIALFALCAALPFDRYLAWQAAAGTQMFHARWIYERLHYDRHPIDIAVIGSSRFEAGISPHVLADRLSARLGRPVSVANLAIVMPGRDFTYEIVRELLLDHPEVRMIVLSDDGFIVNSHPMFRETASPGELLAAPLLVNTRYFVNLLYMPYRNLRNLAEQMFPHMFGVSRNFRADQYLGTNLDRTTGYRLPDGSSINGPIHLDAARLAIQSGFAVSRQNQGLAPFLLLPRDYALAIDRFYVPKIAALLRPRGIGLAFLALPVFGRAQSPDDPAWYRSFGPLTSLDSLAQQPTLFQNGVHLNGAGAIRASQLAGDALAPLAAAMLGNNKSSRTGGKAVQ